MTALFADARQRFHHTLVQNGVLGWVVKTSKSGVTRRVPTIADASQATSRNISERLLNILNIEAAFPTALDANTLGMRFEEACRDFLLATFAGPLQHLRPGRWSVLRKRSIAAYAQYEHLEAIERLATAHDELRILLGTEYVIDADVLVARSLEPDTEINRDAELVDETVALSSALRQRPGRTHLLHASISCKWTMRSDRAQNARSEALNLIRNRKGHLPHVALVTAEPTPTRLASLALGTGDLDCVYHFALPELQRAVASFLAAAQSPSAVRIGTKLVSDLGTMVEGKRLKDISDLPLDLAV